jgi:transposase
MAARAPSSSNFETLDEWIAATCHSFDVSIAVLSNWCELGSETLRGLCVDSDRALYPQTQRKLHDSLGVRFEELERLRPSAVTNSAQVQRLMHARSAGTTDSSKMCEKCGRCHRRAPPDWLGTAIKAYRAGDSYDTVAAHYGVSDTKVKHWLKHEGVEPRSRQASAKRRAYNLGHGETKCQPQPCACGCGQMTSGSIYQVSKRVRRPAQYVKGHAWRDAKLRRPPGGNRNRSELKSAPWVVEVEKVLKRRGWSLANFERHVGFPYTNVMDRDHPKPELVLRAAKVLEIDPDIALELAGWPVPSVIGRKSLDCLVQGEQRTALADRLGVGIETIRNWLTYPERPLALKTLQRVSNGLHLEQKELESERRRAQTLAPDRHRAGKKAEATRRERNPNSDQEKAAILYRATWDTNRRRMLKAVRRGALERRVHIPVIALSQALQEGLSFGEIGKIFSLSDTTVRDRAIEYGLHDGVSSSQRHARRNSLAGVARARQAKMKKSTAHRDAAKEWLRELGTGVLEISRDDVTSRFPIRTKLAQEFLNGARVAALEQASVPSDGKLLAITSSAQAALAQGRSAGNQAQQDRAWRKLDEAVGRLGDGSSDTARRKATGCRMDVIRKHREARAKGRA